MNNNLYVGNLTHVRQGCSTKALEFLEQRPDSKRGYGMSKFLWSIAAVGVLTFVAVPGQAQASWLSQALRSTLVSPPPPSCYYPPGFGYPVQWYSQPGYGSYGQTYAYPQGYGYPQAPTMVPQYPQGYGRSYYNDPQWQHDWREYMERQGRAAAGRPPLGYPVQGYPSGYGNPNYRSYFDDPQWQHDWREYMESQRRR